MPKIDVSKCTFRELTDLHTEIAGLMTQKREEERQALKAKAMEMVTKAGFHLDEIMNTKSAKRGKVAAKYRNPDAPDQTWTGRGRKPLWLAERLAKGAKIEAFAA